VTVLEIAVLAASGFAAGVVNAIAGGGTFFTFAAMVAFGMPTLNANATSAIALVPGSLATMTAYRDEMKAHWREFVPYALFAIAGGVAGAWLLIHIGDEGFRPLVPWLLAVATVTFAASGQLRTLALRFSSAGKQAHGIFGYLLIAALVIYAGFFGAGFGIMSLAVLSIVRPDHFHTTNTLKNVMALLSQSVAIVLFIAGDLVWWPQGLIAMAAAVAGGYAGVLLARRISEMTMRAIVVTAGTVLTIVFLLK
jgi:uncharacterized protein